MTMALITNDELVNLRLAWPSIARLAAHARFVGTLDQAVEQIVAEGLAQLTWIHTMRQQHAASRNQREGRYVGVHRGRHLRTRQRLFVVGCVNADVAWALASQRAGEPLPLRRPRYASPT